MLKKQSDGDDGEKKELGIVAKGVREGDEDEAGEEEDEDGEVGEGGEDGDGDDDDDDDDGEVVQNTSGPSWIDDLRNIMALWQKKMDRREKLIERTNLKIDRLKENVTLSK